MDKQLSKKKEKISDYFLGTIFGFRCVDVGLMCLLIDADFLLSSMRILDLSFDFPKAGIGLKFIYLNL